MTKTPFQGFLTQQKIGTYTQENLKRKKFNAMITVDG